MDNVNPNQQIAEFCNVVRGQEYERLLTKFGEEGRGIEEQAREQIFDTATHILEQCPDPHGHPWERTGLAIGKVQSGKTMSYIALTALAFDSGFRVVIVLAGRTKPLADQNKARFEEDLTSNRPTPKIATFHNPNSHDQDEIQTVLENDGFVLVTLLKHQNRISAVHDIFNIPELQQYPVLIIDDEGDQASHNARRYTGGQSVVYSNILQLRNTLPHHAYVAYTATPQANLLADTIDELSPDFCVLIEPGAGYAGGSTFFGDARDRYIRIIPDDEANHTNLQNVPEYLKLAIASFLVSGAILHLRRPHAFHSMLIHNSTSRAEHVRMQDSVQELIDSWKDALKLQDGDPGTEEVLDFAHRAYDDYLTTVADYPTWDAVSTQLRQEVRALKVWLVNSLPQGSNPSTSPFNLQNNIMVGGNMLDRGVTVRGLAITYITRRAENSQADTIEQRARWFGYKESYLDLCRLYTSQSIANVFTELLSHEDDFWATLQHLEAEGRPVTEWPRMMRLGMGLRPTRSSVARVRELQTDDWTVQGYPALQPETSRANVRVAREFFSDHPQAERREFGSRTHLVVPGQDIPTVTDLLQRMGGEVTGDWDSQYLVEYLRRLHEKDNALQIDVLFMSQGAARARTVRRGRINPMEGHTSRYPGDYNIANDGMQLQVHIVRLRTNRDTPLSEETTALAFFIPPDPVFDLGSFVVPRP